MDAERTSERAIAVCSAKLRANDSNNQLMPAPAPPKKKQKKTRGARANAMTLDGDDDGDVLICRGASDGN